MPLELRVRRDRPFVATELETALADARIEIERAKADDDAWWARYPLDPNEINSRIENQRGQLWFRAALGADGGLGFSVSYSNCRLVRNVTDMLLRLPAIAAKLGGRLFVGEREVDGDTAQALCKEGHSFLEELRKGHEAALVVLDDGPLGAIEIPLGNADLVEEYALFEVIPEDPVSKDELVSALRDDVLLQTTVIEKGDVLFVLRYGEVGAGVQQRADGRWQVRPVHGRSAWPTHALTVMMVMRRIWILGRGEMTWQGEPLDKDLYRGVEARTHGSALEFALYCQSVKPNCRIVPPLSP